MTAAIHSGKLGDIVYSIPILRELGIKHLFLNCTVKRTEEPVMQPHLGLQLAQFLNECCPYFETCLWEGQHFRWDMDRFRHFARRDPSCHLVQCHRMAVGYPDRLPLDLSPWLKVAAPRRARIVVHRSARNHDPSFAWQLLKAGVFVGLGDDWAAFCRDTGLEMAYCETPTITDFAKMVLGGSAFVGNQSLGAAIAEATDHPRAIETCQAGPRAYPLTERGTTRLTAEWLEGVLS